MPFYFPPFSGALRIIGFGAVAQATLAALRAAYGLQSLPVHVYAPDPAELAVAESLGAKTRQIALDPGNYAEALGDCRPGDAIANLSCEVESLSVALFAAARGCFYLDCGIEPWSGFYLNEKSTLAGRSNAVLREKILGARRLLAGSPGALITHGANPGWVSHLAKAGLESIGERLGLAAPANNESALWAGFARSLGIRSIHISERDWQSSPRPKPPGAFANTWSIEGLCAEGRQAAELGWGTAEAEPPAGSCFPLGPGHAALCLPQCGIKTRVRSWTPLGGPMIGFAITHAEALSIPDYLTVRAPDGTPAWRPTCHYAYRPCDACLLSLHELEEREWSLQSARILLRDEIDGPDELGVLLLGSPAGGLWIGSRLSSETARSIAPFNSATTLQVAAGVISGLAYLIENPGLGLAEPEELPHRRMIELALPLIGPLHSQWTSWNPLLERSPLYGPAPFPRDPWQFANFLA